MSYLFVLPTTDAAVGAYGVIVGVVISTIAGLVRSHSTRRSEDRRIVADIVTRLALEQWKFDCERAVIADGRLQEEKKSNILLERSELQISAPSLALVIQRVESEVRAIYFKPTFWRRFCPRCETKQKNG